VASTGVIGEPLPIDKIEIAVPGLIDTLHEEGILDLAEAIMTTDTVPKVISRQGRIDGKTFTITGVAKGAGMIRPDMATMLCFVMTDIQASPGMLQQMLVASVNRSLNRITVDGDTSTNDTVLLLANGQAGNPLLTSLDTHSVTLFQNVLDDLLLDLALQIVKDGEGASKLITVHVKGAKTEDQADKAARTIANSCLFKTACFGEDANWGRIIAALGRSGAYFDANKVEIAFDDVVMVRHGIGLGAEQEKLATAVIQQDAFTLRVHLHEGPSENKLYTCDLSIDYVKINADYRT